MLRPAVVGSGSARPWAPTRSYRFLLRNLSMRKLLDLFCLLLGGLAVLVGVALLILFWLGISAGVSPGQELARAGGVAAVLGGGLFALARWGGRWPTC